MDEKLYCRHCRADLFKEDLWLSCEDWAAYLCPKCDCVRKVVKPGGDGTVSLVMALEQGKREEQCVVE